MVPQIMYGVEVLDMTKASSEKLNVVQRKVGRLALEAKFHTANEAIQGDMGWSEFAERADKARMKYRLRLENLSMNRWPRKVMEWRGGRGRFIRGSDRTLEQYEMAMVDVGMEKNCQ